MGTADFIVHHIHAFTIHITFLILSKGILYARNSRLVSDKLELGFTYPTLGSLILMGIQFNVPGLIHYTLGGIGCTWAFIISRILVLTS